MAVITHTPRHQVWPRGVHGLVPFNDAEQGGRSRLDFDTTGGRLAFRARLDSGATWPVAGLILFLADSGRSVDLSAQGFLELGIASGSLPNLQICMVEEIPGFTRPDSWKTSRYECQQLELRPGQDSYRIPLEAFSTPSWWYSLANVRPSVIGPARRDRVQRLILQTGEASSLHDAMELRIESISFGHDGFRSILALAIGAFLSLVHLVLRFVPRPGQATVATSTAEEMPAAVGLALNFQPVVAVSYADRERQSVLDCLGRDYPDADLSLEKVSRSTGVPAERVTAHLKTAAGLHFKGYLNRIRCEAARKLLLETDLPVSEIALKVGYGSVPHFNRIFRELYASTPSSLRGGQEDLDRPLEGEEEKA